MIVVPLNAKTISFSFGQEFTSNFFNSDGQAKGLAPGTKMGFNLYFNEALSVGFVSVSGDNQVSWDESYLEFIYHIFDDPGVGITFGAGQTTSNSKISNRLGITTTAFKNTKNEYIITGNTTNS